jgi:membrane fusion protein, heavy metal efflux system
MLRFSYVVAGLAVGVSAASMVPEISDATRGAVTVAARLSGLGRLDVREPSTPGAQPHSPDAHDHGEEEEAEVKGREGAITLSPEQILATRIQIAKASGGSLTRLLTVPGTIQLAADRAGRVAAKVVGTVAEMHNRLGDIVQAGDVVAVIDSREVAEAKSEHLAANVNLELQKTLYEREQSLFQKSISAEQQFLRARTSYAEVQLRVDLARQKLAALGVPEGEIARLTRQSTALQRYELRAPISGRIVERLVNLGAAVGGEGQPKELYGIAELSVLWVELAVSPRDLASVKEGQVVQIAVGRADERISGTIIFKSPILNSESRTARVVAQIPNGAQSLLPGAFVTAEIVLEERTADVVVPKTALQAIGNDPVVFVRVPGGFQKREVVIGRSDGRSSEIAAGLVPGEEIAITNTFSLKAELGKAEASHAH